MPLSEFKLGYARTETADRLVARCGERVGMTPKKRCAVERADCRFSGRAAHENTRFS